MSVKASGLSPDERAEALRNLEAYFARIDAKRQPVSDDEEEEIFNEAMRSTRPNFRPIR